MKLVQEDDGTRRLTAIQYHRLIDLTERILEICGGTIDDRLRRDSDWSNSLASREQELHVWIPSQSDATKEFYTALEKLMHDDGIDLKQIEKCEIESCAIVITICNMITRLSEDICHIAEVEEPLRAKMCLVMLYVDSDSSGSKIQYARRTFPNLLEIVEIMFKKDMGINGIIDSKDNKAAVSKIKQTLTARPVY